MRHDELRRAAETEGVELATALGVTKGNDLAALRTLPAVDDHRDNTRGQGYLYFILDGKVLPEDMWATFREGKEAPVPFLHRFEVWSEFPGVALGPERRTDLRAFTDDSAARHARDRLRQSGNNAG